MITITNISYEANDTFVVDIASDKTPETATMTITYNEKPRVRIELDISRDMIYATPYFNAAEMCADLINAIHEAQEEHAAELPSDLEFPMNVR